MAKDLVHGGVTVLALDEVVAVDRDTGVGGKGTQTMQDGA